MNINLGVSRLHTGLNNAAVGYNAPNVFFIYLMVIEINLYIHKEINQSLPHYRHLNHQAACRVFKETTVLTVSKHIFI